MTNSTGIYPITNSDQAVLGLAAESPRHGCHLERDIPAHGRLILRSDWQTFLL